MKIKKSKKIRLAVYVQIALQAMLPVQMGWASSAKSIFPAQTSGENSLVALPRPDVINIDNRKIDTARHEAELISLYYYKRGYTIKAGDTLDSIAKIARVSLLTLREINRIHMPDDNEYYAFKEGDYLMIPDWKRPIHKTIPRAIAALKLDPASPSESARVASHDSQESNHKAIEATLTGIGGALQSRDQGAAARGLAVNTATGAATQSIKEWMDNYGNARVTLSVDDHLKYNGASTDLLIPLSDKDADNLYFTQVGITDKDHYTTANLGAGQRFFFDKYMLGYNAFLDHELRNQHTRIGAGVEYWRDYLKLAGNLYAGASGWKESKQLEDYEERPASGFDLRADAWLPAHPQLGGRLRLEQYFGDQVGLVSASDRQKDPTAVTVGVNYTPIPLITAGVDQRFSNGKSDTQLSLQLNYQLGTPLNQQLDPEHVNDRRTLAGSRLDFVDRNNAMVMEYRKMEVIKLSLPPILKGEVLQSHTISSTVKTRHGLKKVDWDTSALLAAGARVTATKDNTLSLTLPSVPGSYPLSAIAWDTKGNASNTASMVIEVDKNTPSPGHQISHLQANPLQQKANGVDVITYTLRAVGPDGNPVKNTRVQWTSDRGDVQQPETLTNNSGEATTTLLSHDAGKVNLNAILLDDAGNKLTDRLHKDAEFIISKHTLTLDPDKVTAKPDGTDAITFTFNLKDAAGQAVADHAIEWRNVDGVGTLTPQSTSTDAQGIAKATLISSAVGTTKVAVKLKNADGSDGEEIESRPVSFTAVAAPVITLNTDHNESWALDSHKRNLSIQVMQSGAPVVGKELQWALNGCQNCTLSELNPVTDSNGNASVQIHSIAAGNKNLSICLKDDPSVCSSDVDIEVLDLPTIEHRAKGSSAWNQGNWSNKPLLKGGNIELQVSGGGSDISWQPGTGISVSGSGDKTEATLDAPSSLMTVDYTVHSSEPKMALTQQITLSGITLFMPTSSPTRMNYQSAMDACLAAGANQVSEGVANTTFSVWGSFGKIGNYSSIFRPWLAGTKGYDSNNLDLAKALDMEAGTEILGFNAVTSTTHAFCEK